MIKKVISEFVIISGTICNSADAVHNRAKSVRELITMISDIADQTN